MGIRECDQCSTPLVGRQLKYCGPDCAKMANKAGWLEKVYGISPEEWKELFEFQGGVCAVCKREPLGRRNLVVDHEHDGGPSGKVRGLICNIPCNLRIIAKHKDYEILANAAEYLKNPPAVELFGERLAPGRPRKKRQPRKRPRNGK